MLSAILTDKLQGHKSLREVFRSWDMDKDGVISKSEFGCMMHCMGINLSKYEMDAVFDKIDVDQVGGCRYGGFLRLVTGGKPYSQTEKQNGSCGRDARTVRDFATHRG